MLLFILEHRCIEDEITTVEFIGSSIEKCVEFMKNNTDYGRRNLDWWWVVYPAELDHDIHNQPRSGHNLDTFHVFDWDGNEMENQPIKGYRQYKLDRLTEDE